MVTPLIIKTLLLDLEAIAGENGEKRLFQLVQPNFSDLE